ncbi:DUF2267 domain-containing protein [Streptomyces sp. NPDC015127]|uniref:DUF2267 domain-containing protein n=1 Tax=Streptomyces sp. NPDC015127 TaxID=3364939 RepID=UPI003701C88B
MITHADLTQDVVRLARLTDADQALRVIRVVLASLAHRLPMPQRRRLREAMPGPERDAAYATVPPAADDVTGLVGEVARHLDVPPERARFLAQAVLSRIAEDEPELGQDLREHLADGYAPLFSPPPAYAERMHSATDAPAPLTSDEVDRELGRRPQWSGDPGHLTRIVALPEDRLPPLLNAVERAARDARHQVDVKRTDGGVAFTLSTRSVHAVTRLDLELADRIDEAVAAVGSGGHPG